MSSEDTFHKEHPELDDWLTKPDQPREGRRSGPVLSGIIQRLARRLGLDLDELRDTIEADTIRRTKYPVRERRQPDGTTLFEHDEGIIEGPRALHHR